jgi:hypothetical protein
MVLERKVLQCKRLSTNILQYQGRTQEETCRAGSPQTPQNRNLKKKTDFVDIMIQKALRDLPFSRNQPLKSADG